MNLNSKIKTNQLALLVGITAVVGAGLGGIFYFSSDKDAEQQVAEPVPQMTGVVDQTLTDQISQDSMKAQQEKQYRLEDQLQDIKLLLEQQKSTAAEQNSRLEEQAQKLRLLEAEAESQKRLQEVAKNQNINLPVQDANGTPLPKGLAGQQVPTANMNANSYYSFPGANTLGLTPAQSQPVMTQPVLRSVSVHPLEKPKEKKKSKKLPYVPSGSFSDAIIIEGADANASVTGEQNTSPVQFRLQGKLVMPNDKEFNMDGCFVTGEIWGDISSERGEVRTRKVSCTLKSGETVDQDLPGHVAFQGKQGIKGRPIMRNGKIVMYAGAAGIVSGVGSGINSAATPIVGVGGSATASASDIAKQGLGGGAEGTGNMLSNYWIKRAEQYHPVIEIGAGNKVTVVFQDGFQLKTIEEIEAEKEAEKQASEQKQNNQSSSQQPVVSTTGGRNADGTPASSNYIPDPTEVLKQAKQLQLGQTIQ